jgi:hypothetical protein
MGRQELQLGIFLILAIFYAGKLRQNGFAGFLLLYSI